MTVNAKLDTCAARIDALSSRFERFSKRRMDAVESKSVKTQCPQCKEKWTARINPSDVAPKVECPECHTKYYYEGQRGDAAGKRPGHMERSLHKLGKSPEEAKQIAGSIKEKTKYARSHGGSEPDLTPVKKETGSISRKMWDKIPGFGE